MNKVFRILLGMAVASAIAFPLSTPVMAQKDAGSKARGEHSVPFWSSRSSARRLSGVQHYARDFQRHLATNPRPAPTVVREAPAEIGKNLQAAKKDLAQLKEDFAGNKEAVAGIETLEKQVAAAFEQHRLLHECCESQPLDKALAMKCCDELEKQLEIILADHDALMHKLSPSAASAPTKTK